MGVRSVMSEYLKAFYWAALVLDKPCKRADIWAMGNKFPSQPQPSSLKGCGW